MYITTYTFSRPHTDRNPFFITRYMYMYIVCMYNNLILGIGQVFGPLRLYCVRLGEPKSSNRQNYPEKQLLSKLSGNLSPVKTGRALTKKNVMFKKVLKIVKHFLFCFSLCAPQFCKFDILIIHIKINWIYFSRMQRLCEM